MTATHSIQRGYFQVVILYRYPKSSRTDFKNDIYCHLRPVVDLTKLVTDRLDNSEFVDFMEALFSCVQQIKQSTTDSGLTIVLIFANCQAFCNVIEAYWTDHTLIYCVIDA